MRCSPTPACALGRAYNGALTTQQALRFYPLLLFCHPSIASWHPFSLPWVFVCVQKILQRTRENRNIFVMMDGSLAQAALALFEFVQSAVWIGGCDPRDLHAIHRAAGAPSGSPEVGKGIMLYNGYPESCRCVLEVCFCRISRARFLSSFGLRDHSCCCCCTDGGTTAVVRRPSPEYSSRVGCLITSGTAAPKQMETK